MNLSIRGYSILKENYSSLELLDIKKDLTVKPFINQDFSAPPNPFPYMEKVRENYIYQGFME